MVKKTIIFIIFLIITIFNLFFYGQNFTFAQCVPAFSCEDYRNDPCREDPPGSGFYIGLDNPINKICLKCPIIPCTLEELLARITSLIFYIATVLYPLMLMIAAFFFTTAGAKPSNIEKAKNILIYSSIGYSIVMLANILVYVIKSVIGAT